MQWTDIYFTSKDAIEWWKTVVIVRDFKPSASKRYFILSCERFSSLDPFDMLIPVHNAEFDRIAELQFVCSCRCILGCQCDDSHSVCIS